MTDNGPAFKSGVFAALGGSMHIRHLRTRPYTLNNGKAERFRQLLREAAYRFAYDSWMNASDGLAAHMHFYNFHRVHSSLAYNPPISRVVRNNVLVRNRLRLTTARPGASRMTHVSSARLR
jgi:transposase InsO family protein